jgi:hypothetical protein
MTWRVLRRRAALGLAPAIVPVSAYVPLGFVLGPSVSNLLSADVLAHLDAVVSVALATLGVFIGLAVATQTRASLRLFAAATVESGVTIALVAGSLLLLLRRWDLPLAGSAVLVACVLGAAAAASAAGSAEGGERIVDPVATHVADLDDALPIVVGAIAVAFALPRSSSMTALVAIALPVGIGLLVGIIGWLLFEPAQPVERGVFVLGAIAMAGGAAAYAGVSPLLTGAVCGIFWRLAPGRADAIIAADLAKFHHPLVLLLLLDAGAQIAPAVLPVWLLAPFVVFRMTGKLLGGWIASQLSPSLAAEALGAYLVPPGVVGIAVALNFQQVSPLDGAAVVSAVAAGAVIFELLSTFVAQRSTAA